MSKFKKYKINILKNSKNNMATNFDFKICNVTTDYYLDNVNLFNKKIFPNVIPKVPIIRIFGITDNGNYLSQYIE